MGQGHYNSLTIFFCWCNNYECIKCLSCLLHIRKRNGKRKLHIDFFSQKVKGQPSSFYGAQLKHNYIIIIKLFAPISNYFDLDRNEIG